MQYCDLGQNEIDNNVFNHTNPFKNIKRKYVFQIIYGAYGIESALLQEQLREVIAKIRSLSADATVLQRLLERTPWANRAELNRRLEEARREVEDIEAALVQTASASTREPETHSLRARVQELDTRITDLRSELDRETTSNNRLRELSAQLGTQSARLTRSIVADTLLTNIEFVICPRCGSDVSDERASDERCKLCLQTPSFNHLQREDFIREQDRVQEQISETDDLMRRNAERISNLTEQLERMESERRSVASDLDLRTSSYVSDVAEELTRRSEERGRLRESVQRYEDYLLLFSNYDNAASELAALDEQKDELERRLVAQRDYDSAFRDRVAMLTSEFDSVLTAFSPPQFAGEDTTSRIDPETYLPTLYGRRFDELSSQGLKVLVNVAHALAHQRVNILMDLALPNILLVDGLTTNMGHHEGLDAERVQAIYSYLVSLSAEMGDRLQIIVADHDIPDEARQYIVADFSDEDRLVPQ